MLPVKCNAKEIDFQYEKSGYQGKVDKKAITMTSLVTTWKVVDVDSGESIEIESPGNGADTQDKGAGKAFTYAYKNAIQKMFMLFSGEDTDNDHSDKLDNAGTQVSVTMLKEAINNVGTDEQTILDSYCDKYKKTCTELKFMSQEGKQYYYNRMTKAKK
ncbi:hypothetical protein MHBO_004454 [Bonamia ostreae]|uniref:Uncharacterized protein n=1 Tax=Bonamia ostreae TaxID=126728 RepID=A0ABV2ATD5_9EUKA